VVEESNQYSPKKPYQKAPKILITQEIDPTIAGIID
jgi:hypothetical protein